MRVPLVAVLCGMAAMLLLQDVAQASDGAIEVVGLRCEYLVNPLGIDVVQPRLSWKITTDDPAARGLRQAAYQVLVAGDEKSLADDRGDLWDSGQIESDQSTQVVYGGKPLEARMVCWWKVRVRDQAGRVSAWSKPAFWSMGLLKPADWTAQWIGESKPDGRQSPWFRKAFTVQGKPTRATAYVASLGYHELYINGVKADDRALAPSTSELSKHVRYVTYDVAKYLHDGQNVVALWCGPGWAAYAPYQVAAKPLVMAQLEVQPADGPLLRVATDGQWKTHPSPISLLGNWRAEQYGGERYDAGRELKGWNDVGLDDSGWASAAVFRPGVQLIAEMVEPNRAIETLRPTAIEALGNGVYRVDLGRNYAGWFKARLRGRPGSTATLEFSERPNEPCSFSQKSEYVFGPTGEGVFRQRFNYAASRWVTIRDLTAAPDPNDVCGYLVTTDCPRVTQFECSDDLLNRIDEATLWTFRSLSLGGYTVDCPHRERMGYGGDAHATMETAMTNFGMGAFYTKWLGDWRDVQQADGNLPYTAPTHLGGGGPAWSGICVTLPWQVYLHYGDRRVLEQNYPMMRRWMEFLQTKTKSDLLQCWGGEWDFLGDWVPPGKGQAIGDRVDDRSTLLFNNCYYADNLATAAKVAELLGKPEATEYRRRAKAIAAATHREFFNPKDNSYANGTQLYEAMPLLMGVTPTAIQPAVLRRLEQEIVVTKNGHLDTGIHGTAYLLRCLLERNRSDLVLLMARQRTYPGWGYMLEQGSTTIWEQWDGKQSLLHSSFLPIGAWCIEGPAGIRLDPATPGYKHFIVRPGVVGPLRWAKGQFDSPYGRVATDWRLADGRLTFTVDVPPNSSATVYVPTDDPASVTESGRPAAKSPGVKALSPVNGAAAFELGSGRYVFQARKLGG